MAVSEMNYEPMLPQQGGALEASPLSGMPSQMGQNPMQGNIEPGQDGEELATEEQKQELRDLLEKVKSEYARFDSGLIARKNEDLSRKNDLQKQFLELLKEMGVDVNNLDSINEFIQELEQSNPDMAELFEKAVDYIFPEEGSGNYDEQGMETPLPMPGAPEQGMEQAPSPEMPPMM